MLISHYMMEKGTHRLAAILPLKISKCFHSLNLAFSGLGKQKQTQKSPQLSEDKPPICAGGTWPATRLLLPTSLVVQIFGYIKHFQL